MILKAWVILKSGELLLDARFISKMEIVGFDLKKIKLILNKDLVIPSSDSWLECKIDFSIASETGKILEILSTIAGHEFLPTNRITAIVSENENGLLNTKKETLKNEIPEDLVIDQMVWDLIVSTIEDKDYPLFIGPKGTGKTATAYAIAKHFNYDFYPINCGSIFKPKQTLVGQLHAKEGSTYLVDSEFLTYFTSDKKTLIFLDEISRIPSAASNYFMTILDPTQEYIYIEELGKKVYKGNDVIFVAAANFGLEYTDTRNLDGALVDRFVKFLVNYLPPQDEEDLIIKRIGITKQQAKALVKHANICRENFDKLRVSVSTRQLLKMAKYLKKGFQMRDVIDNIFLNLFINGSFDMREDVKKMFKGIN